MTNHAESSARFDKSQPVIIRAICAERRGDYRTAAAAFDEVADIYGEHGGDYRKAAKRCRRFLAKQVG